MKKLNELYQPPLNEVHDTYGGAVAHFKYSLERHHGIKPEEYMAHPSPPGSKPRRVGPPESKKDPIYIANNPPTFAKKSFVASILRLIGKIWFLRIIDRLLQKSLILSRLKSRIMSEAASALKSMNALDLKSVLKPRSLSCLIFQLFQPSGRRVLSLNKIG